MSDNEAESYLLYCWVAILLAARVLTKQLLLARRCLNRGGRCEPVGVHLLTISLGQLPFTPEGLSDYVLD